MFNKKKLVGILISLVGVLLTRSNLWFEPGSLQAFFVKTAGVMMACIGLAVFASGIKNKIEKTIRICPNCFKKNDAENEICRKCKKPLEKLMQK
jgi:sulfite exporter TauE/SafE